MYNLESHIKKVPNFPKPGIEFLDISPILGEPKLFYHLVELMENKLEGVSFDKLVAIESRGFLLGSALAYKMKKGLVMVRKPGKLPGETISESYDLEYGTDKLEILKSSLSPNEKVVIIDDVLATGGTAKAVANLCNKLNAKLQASLFFIELSFLNGRSKLDQNSTLSLIIK